MNTYAAIQYISEKLEKELSPLLTYHHFGHTLAVANRAIAIAHSEGVEQAETLSLLSIAAYFHDAGFLISHENHEYHSCQIVQAILPSFAFSDAQIEHITALIMATKIPQSPKNQLAEILCDADLDYLGDHNFYAISQTLWQELYNLDKIDNSNNWNQIQVHFLESHRYFTPTNQLARNSEKQKRIEELKSKY
ncbi:HD domain-containing protein [Flectobacillus major]|uniref:HD domain-containing protein n=1 Tax=Flectobacillus major TaxID=103 RepID=UPI0004268619|nr:HD domain-containing protein [Flectobacillus major]